MNAQPMFPRRVAPKLDESLVGYLMRVAEHNQLSTRAVLTTAVGRHSRPPDAADVQHVAEACRCSLSEITQLFGFQLRRADGVWSWRLGNEWITKSYFVSSRSLRVCVPCINENAFLPGTWELTMYQTCAFHRSQLLVCCPSCHKPLRWNRKSICQCQCGYDFRGAETTLGSSASWLIAQLVEQRINPHFRLVCPPDISPQLIQRLGKLSLDGLFKTLWFLGHCVGNFDACCSGHGRVTKRVGESNDIIECAFAVLRDWPTSLVTQLNSIAKRADVATGENIYRRTFGPIISYLNAELTDHEFAFIRASYESYVRQVWRQHGQRQIPIDLDRQRGFDFGQ